LELSAELVYGYEGEKNPCLHGHSEEKGVIMKSFTSELAKFVEKTEPEFPVSDDELKNKFMSLATDLVSDKRAEGIWEMGMNIEALDDLSEFTAMLRAE